MNIPDPQNLYSNSKYRPLNFSNDQFSRTLNLSTNQLINFPFCANLAAKAKATASTFRGNETIFNAAKTIDGKKETYWSTDDDVKTGTVEVDLGSQQLFKYIVLQEHIKLGQRVSAFTVEVKAGANWKQVVAGTTIGYKRILKIEPITTQQIRITINDAKACPLISEIAVY